MMDTILNFELSYQTEPSLEKTPARPSHSFDSFQIQVVISVLA